MQRWTLPKIKKVLKKVSNKRWIKATRMGDTGIGETLERELELKENNISLPDFGIMELKSQRANTKSMITLFTKKPEGITNKEIRKKFGYKDKEFPKIKCLRQTIDGGKKNRRGFWYKIDKKNNQMLIKKNRLTIGYYSLAFLEQKAEEKIGDGLIFVLADTKKENGKEFFHYKKAYLLKDIDPLKFLSYSKYDIRLGVYKTGLKKGLPHDHGSAFRLFQKSFSEIFKTRKRLL